MRYPPVVYYLYLVYRAFALIVRQNRNSIVINLSSRAYRPFLYILNTVHLPLK